MGRGGGAGTGRRAWRVRVVGSQGRVGEDPTGRRGRAPLCGDPGIELTPEDQPVVEDGGMQGKIVATSEAPSFLSKERLISSTAEGKSLPLHSWYCSIRD